MSSNSLKSKALIACNNTTTESVKELREIAKSLEISKSSTMSKKQLCDKISEKLSLTLNFVESNGGEVPDEFVDSISGEIMLNPYILSDGFSYNKNTIDKLLEHDSKHDLRGPESRMSVSKTFIVPNVNLKKAVLRWLIENGREINESIERNDKKESIESRILYQNNNVPNNEFVKALLSFNVPVFSTLSGVQEFQKQMRAENAQNDAQEAILYKPETPNEAYYFELSTNNKQVYPTSQLWLPSSKSIASVNQAVTSFGSEKEYIQAHCLKFDYIIDTAMRDLIRSGINHASEFKLSETILKYGGFICVQSNWNTIIEYIHRSKQENMIGKVIFLSLNQYSLQSFEITNDFRIYRAYTYHEVINNGKVKILQTSFCDENDRRMIEQIANDY